MLDGNRKFIAFLISITIYFVLNLLVILLIEPATFHLESFVVQLGIGIMSISGAFFIGNVGEHFSKK